MAENVAVKLQNTTDAAVWTDEFMKLVEAGMTIDWGVMVGWFANAIEVGREAGRTALIDGRIAPGEEG